MIHTAGDHEARVGIMVLKCGCRIVRCAECKEGYRIRCSSCGGGTTKIGR